MWPNKDKTKNESPNFLATLKASVLILFNGELVICTY